MIRSRPAREAEKDKQSKKTARVGEPSFGLKRAKAALEWIEPENEEIILKVGKALLSTGENAAPEVWAKWSGRPRGEWDSWIVETPINQSFNVGLIFWMAQRKGWRYPVVFSGNQLEVTVEQCERALIRGGAEIYRVTGGTLVHPVEVTVPAARDQQSKQKVLAPFNLHSLRSFQTTYIDWRRFDGQPGAAPDKATNAMLNRGQRSLFPFTTGVIMTPTLRPNGSLLIERGYDKTTGLILCDYPKMQSIPPEPTRAQAEIALGLLEGLLEGFPFVDAGSRSVALSALITPIVRGALECVPLHGISSPAAGTGKSFLLDVAAAIAMGEPCPIMHMGGDEDELEKRLVQRLRYGGILLSIDNVPTERAIHGAALCQFVERPRIEPRILGQSAGVALLNNWTLCATGNHLWISEDMTRRTRFVCWTLGWSGRSSGRST